MDEYGLGKWLAEWVGFTRYNSGYELCWKAPGSREAVIGGYPNFPKDLTALFEWVVPKFRVEFGDAKTQEILNEWIDEFLLHSPTSPALHLCGVIRGFLEREYIRMCREYSEVITPGLDASEKAKRRSQEGASTRHYKGEGE